MVRFLQLDWNVGMCPIRNLHSEDIVTLPHGRSIVRAQCSNEVIVPY